jgi:hypothetical protein
MKTGGNGISDAILLHQDQDKGGKADEKIDQ